jgi:hypothetical protein
MLAAFPKLVFGNPLCKLFCSQDFEKALDDVVLGSTIAVLPPEERTTDYTVSYVMITAAVTVLPVGEGTLAELEVEAAGAFNAGRARSTFSIADWSGYPAGVPRPNGPFWLREGADYEAARGDANLANRALRKLMGVVGDPVEVHEIQPVKFGGNPTDPANKVVLPRDLHRQQVTPWWNQLLRDIGGQ